MPTSEAIYGRLRFLNQLPLEKAGLYGRVKFTDQLELRRHPSIYGRVYMVDTRAFPPLGVVASYALVESPGFATAVVEFGRHTEQRLALDSQVRWRFKLQFSILSAAERDLLCAHFLARRGSFEPFTLLSPVGAADRIVRYARSEAEFELFTYRLYAFNDVELIEINETFY